MSETKTKSYTRIYTIWQGMKQRCYNKNNNSYYRYGGRGITVCDEWLHDSSAFIEWALANGYTEDLTLDRIDNNGEYSPNNCQWISRSENSKKAPKGIVYHSKEAAFYRLYKQMLRNGVDPDKYGVKNPYA